MFQKFALPLVAALVLFIISPAQADDPPAQAAALAQRMRIAVGDYWIGGGGGGTNRGDGSGYSNGDGPANWRSGSSTTGGWTAMAGAPPVFPAGLTGGPAGALPQIVLPPIPDGGFRLPASCIDEGRDPPDEDTKISHVSGNAIVQKYVLKDGQFVLVEERPLDKAIDGPDAWLKLSGLDEAEGINLQPVDSSASYRIVVPELAIAGENASDVRSVHEAWTGNPAMLEKSKSLDALRSYLAAIPDLDRGVLDMLESARQLREWHEFGHGKDGAAIPAATNTASLGDWIDRIIGDYFQLDSTTLTATDRLDWITLLLGREPTAQDSKFLDEHFAGVAFARPDHPEVDARLVKSFAALAATPETAASALASFARSRHRQKLGFEDALRQASFAIDDTRSRDEVTGDTLWATGQPALLALQDLNCRTDTDQKVRQAEALLKTRFGLMRGLGVYTAASADAGLVKVSVHDGDDDRDDEMACLVRLTDAGKAEGRWLPLRALTRDFIRRELGGATLVAADRDSRDSLKDNGIEIALLTDAARGMAVKTFVPKDRTGEEVFEHPNRAMSAAPGLDFATLNLETKGDALVARLPDGSFLMIDTGLGEDTLSQFTGYLSRNYPDKKPPLRIVITHSHADHIGGLQHIADAGFEIQEVLIGRSMQDGGVVDRLFEERTGESETKQGETKKAGAKESRTRKGKAKAARKAPRPAVLAGGKPEQVRLPDMPGVTHYVKAGVTPLFDWRARQVSSGGAIESWSLQPIAGVQIDVHHLIRAREPNDGGLLVRLGYKGMHWLLCDDLSDTAWLAIAPASAWSSIFGDDADALNLSAGVLKWPHHLWFPNEKDKAQIARLKAMLLRINPHTIIFSNTGHTTHNKKRYKEIKAFVAELLPNVQTRWTQADDRKRHIIYLTESQIRLPRHAGLALPGE